jgi:hypothetical protein
MSGDSSGRNQPRIKSSKRIFGRSRYPDNRALTHPARRNDARSLWFWNDRAGHAKRCQRLRGEQRWRQRKAEPSLALRGGRPCLPFAFASRASRVNRPREAVEKWSTRTDGTRRRGRHPRVRCLVGSEHPASLEVAPDQGQQEVNKPQCAAKTSNELCNGSSSPVLSRPEAGTWADMTNNQSVPPEPVPPPEPPPGPDVPEADRARVEGRLVDARPPVHADPLAWLLPPL